MVKSGKQGLLFHILIQILIFSVLTGLTFLAFQPVQRAVQGRMQHIRDDIIGRAEKAIGRQIRYGSIGPSIFGAFEIRNVRILGRESDSPETLLTPRLRLYWSLWDLLKGRPQTIRSVLIERPQINLDLERDKDLIEWLISVQDINLLDIFPGQVQFRIRGGGAYFQNRKDLFRFEGADLDIRSDGVSLSLGGKWTTGIFLRSPGAAPLDVRIGMQVSGDCAPDFSAVNAVITVSSLTGDRFQLRQGLAFNCVLRDRTFNIRKLDDRQSFGLILDYNFREEVITARFNCDQYSPRELVTLSGDWKGANHWLVPAVSGTAAFESRRDGETRYRINFSGGMPGAGDADFFAIRASGNENEAVIEECRLSMPPLDTAEAGLFQGNIGFQGTAGLGPFAPAGTLSLENVSFSGDTGINAELEVQTRKGVIHIGGERAALGSLMLRGFRVSLVPSARELGFSISALRPQVPDSNGPAAFSLKGALNYTPQRVEASLSLDSFVLSDIAEAARPFVKEPLFPAFVRSAADYVALNTEIFFSTDFKKMVYKAPRIELAFDPDQNGKGMAVGFFSVSGTDRGFELSEGRLFRNDSGVIFSGYADYSKPLDIEFSLLANYENISYSMEGRILDRKQISVHGSYGFQVYITSTDEGAYSGWIEGKSIPIPIQGLPAKLSFFSSVRYNSVDFWSIDVENFEVRDIAGPAGLGRLRIAGGIDQDGVHFPLLSYSDDTGPLGGRADISWTRDFSGFVGAIRMEEMPPPMARDGGSALALADMVLPGPHERYFGTCSFENESLSFSLSGSRMRLGRFLYNVNGSRAEGDLSITWTREQSYRAYLTVNSVNLKVRDQELRAAVRASLTPEEFTVWDLQLSIAGLEGTIPFFRINRNESVVQTSARFGGFLGGEMLEGAFSVTANFAPVSSWWGLGRAVRSFSGNTSVDIFRYGTASSQPFNIAFSRNEGEFSVSGGPKDMLRLRLEEDGTFYAGLSNPFPVRGSVAGILSDNAIDARADLYIDLAGLWKLIPPVSEIGFSGGIVNAQVDIRGSLSDPEFYGTARGTSLRIQVPNYIARDIRPVPFTVTLEGNEARFGPVPATVGTGAGNVTGLFTFDRWIPNIFTLDIIVPRETPIPFACNVTGLLARGDVSGKLTLAMADVIFDIKGDLLANNTEMGLKADDINPALGNNTYQQAGISGTDNPAEPFIDAFSQLLYPVVMDLKITTGPSVEFLWPSSGFPILRASAAQGTVVHFTMDSPARQFTLNSNITIRGGEVFYFERNFYIRSGTITFRENENRFDPRLTVRAEIRDWNDEGPVTIAMIVDNAPLLSFTARFESTPPLSQAEIVSLLGQGITGNQDDESAGTVPRALLSATSDILAQFGVVRQVERQIRNFLHLDMFSLRTQVLQNTLFGTTGFNRDPIDRNARVGNYFDNTTVFLGKYIGPDMFIQSMFSLRYDENYTANNWGLRIEPDIGVELQSPLFNIRWNIVPTHPENWYLSDNSITLTWRRTF